MYGVDTFPAAIPLMIRADSAPEASGRLHALLEEIGELLEAHPQIKLAEGYDAMFALQQALANVLYTIWAADQAATS